MDAELFQTFPEICQFGFLPEKDPLQELPPGFGPWEERAADLPKLLTAGRVKSSVRAMPLLDPALLHTSAEQERAMLLLSYLGHAFVWGETQPADRLPQSLAIPWHALSVTLGRPPVLSYASYALHNWRRMNPAEPVALGNIVLLQNFLGGIDEEWFVLVHVDIEAQAVQAMRAVGEIHQGLVEHKIDQVKQGLAGLARSLDGMNATMRRMPEHCDPYIYFNRVRPYLFGWKNHPGLPQGMVYEGVEAYGGAAQFFRGETGAQSGIVPCLDAILGVEHQEDPLRTYLMEMRDYMPPRHRAFLVALEKGPKVRAMAREAGGKIAELLGKCLEGVAAFRAQHYEYAARYIHQQQQKNQANRNDVGTGGTPFMPYLKKHLDETK